jgi:hypothetical protein
MKGSLVREDHAFTRRISEVNYCSHKIVTFRCSSNRYAGLYLAVPTDTVRVVFDCHQNLGCRKSRAEAQEVPERSGSSATAGCVRVSIGVQNQVAAYRAEAQEVLERVRDRQRQ